jgi:hypothetical protein
VSIQQSIHAIYQSRRDRAKIDAELEALQKQLDERSGHREEDARRAPLENVAIELELSGPAAVRQEQGSAAAALMSRIDCIRLRVPGGAGDTWSSRAGDPPSSKRNSPIPGCIAATQRVRHARHARRECAWQQHGTTKGCATVAAGEYGPATQRKRRVSETAQFWLDALRLGNLSTL